MCLSWTWVLQYVWRERARGERRERRGWSHRSVITPSGAAGEERWPFHKLKAQRAQITWQHVQESGPSRELSNNEQWHQNTQPVAQYMYVSEEFTNKSMLKSNQHLMSCLHQGQLHDAAFVALLIYSKMHKKFSSYIQLLEYTSLVSMLHWWAMKIHFHIFRGITLKNVWLILLFWYHNENDS